MTFPSRLGKAQLEAPLRHALLQRARVVAANTEAVPSAVLIALFEKEHDIHLWLVKRPETMRKHSGQVAFPGGKRDATDASLLHTALREAEEEIGLSSDRIEVVGALDDLVTGTGFVITPHVAWVDSSFVPTPNPSEVVRAFTAPLRIFSTRAYGIFPRIGHNVEGEFVWGATFAMARNLSLLARDLSAEL